MQIKSQRFGNTKHVNKKLDVWSFTFARAWHVLDDIWLIRRSGSLCFHQKR